MREILFRGKAINRDKGYHLTEYKNGEWVYGLVTKLYDEQFKSLPAEMTNTNGISGIEIDYKTIGRYTGLNDKNGTKIFEGDIIKQYFENLESEYDYRCCDIGRVFWYQHQTRFLRTSKLFTDDCSQMLEHYEYEIIGNIYDNPELLEE